MKKMIKQRSRTRTISRAVYTDTLGNPVSPDVIQDLNQFQVSKRSGTIDVWWLYDDGGLTLLLPYILTNRKYDLDRETRNMAALLAKFRIEFSSVIVIPDVTKRASDASRERLDPLLAKIPKDTIPEEE